jgi:DNA-binding NarL/FixJ family response regulator
LLDGLRSLLGGESRIEVIAEALDGYTALELVSELSPDVVIIEVALPMLNGIEATRQIFSQNPGVKILALSMYSDIKYAAEMFKAGAVGYLPKDCSYKELIFAIKSILSNKIYLSPNLVGAVVKDIIVSKKDPNSVFSVLTPKERQVLQLMAEGKTRNQIAEALFISERTVETHHRNITKKLGINSIAELTKYAIREGLTNL